MAPIVEQVALSVPEDAPLGSLVAPIAPPLSYRSNFYRNAPKKPSGAKRFDAMGAQPQS